MYNGDTTVRIVPVPTVAYTFPAEGRGEAPKTAGEGTEPFTAKSAPERPATEQLMEEV